MDETILKSARIKENRLSEVIGLARMNQILTSYIIDGNNDIPK